jgi:hypothetical protein
MASEMRKILLLEKAIRADLDKSLQNARGLLERREQITSGEGLFKAAKNFWNNTQEWAGKLKKLEYSKEHLLEKVDKKTIREIRFLKDQFLK